MLSHHRSIRYEYDKASFAEPLKYGAYRVYQMGDICTDSNYHCGSHRQRCHEISFILKGEAEHHCNDEIYHVKSGDIIFSPYGSMHDIYTKSDDYHCQYIGFMIEDGFGEDQMLEDYYNNAPCGCATAIKSVKYSFYNILSNMYNNDEYSSRILADAVRCLLISTLRSFRGDKDWQYSLTTGREYNILVSQVCAYIDASAENKDALMQISDNFNYSYSHISNIFSKAMNMSLKDYFLMRRHEKACELLRNGVSVTDTAYRIGYSSIHAFCHFFSNRAGMSPGVYQRKQRANSKNEKTE